LNNANAYPYGKTRGEPFQTIILSQRIRSPMP
jgi:hypothetical protein